MAFSMAQTQSAAKVKAEKPNCYQPCSKVADANSYLPFYYVLNASANEKTVNNTNTMTSSEKAECQKICAKKIAANGKCDPKDCPPECLPPNCKIVPCKAKSTTMAINQKPSDQK